MEPTKRETYMFPTPEDADSAADLLRAEHKLGVIVYRSKSTVMLISSLDEAHAQARGLL